MPKLTIDGQEVEVPAGSTVLQACEAAGREIPVFCYHPRLNIAGNCRMCLVEMEKSPKPIASCAMPAADNMVIRTDTPTVHKARKGVLELLLINHPLDCPICDQGGECDLQDLTLFYGPDHSRFSENKRPVADKYLGPLVSTHMTRCIHCTRCIRFLKEVAGVEELGAVSRGEHMEITNYIEASLTSEVQGNIIDLCPVGALNSKPYEYRARTWELKKTESIDVMDAVGSNIRVDARGNEVMRILPRLSEEVNEEWISDKTRFVYDGLRRRRLDVPMVKTDGKLAPTGWREAFAAIRARLEGVDGRKVAFIVGDLVDCETMVLVKELASALGSPHVDCRQDGAKVAGGARAGYLFNTTIAGIEQADACLLVGANPRWEAPIVNLRLRKRWRQGGFRIGRIGAPVDLAIPVQDLGAGGQTLSDLLEGGHSFGEVLSGAKNAMLIVGPGAIARPDGAAVLALAREVAGRFDMVRDGLERVQRPAHGGLPGGRARPRPGARRGRPRRGRHPGRCCQRRDRDRVPDRGGRDRHRPARQRLRRLPGPPWRPRCGRGRRDPAGCGLHREARHLRQHRGPAAAGRARGLPARRGQGGLAHPAGAVRGAGPSPSRSTRWPRCATACRRSHRSWPIRARSCPAAWGEFGAAGGDRQGALRLADRRLLPDQRDLPGVGEHAPLQRGDPARRRAARGDGHPWLSCCTSS